MRAAALLGELRPLGHAEAVLLVGHNEAEVAEHNGLTQKRVRADDQLRLAGGELFTRGALLRGSSGAGQQQHAHAERPEQLRERPRVLLGQNFRGGHKGGLSAVPDSAEARGSCDHCLAAADIALHEPVHHMAGGQIAQDLVNCAALRTRQPEGQRAEKRVHAGGVIRDGMQIRSRCAQDGQTRRENEKFLKDEPLPRPLQRVPALRRMDRRIRLRHAAQAVLLPHRLRQKLRQRARRRKRLPDAGAERPVGQPRRQRVHRQQPVRNGAGPAHLLKGRIRHLHPVLQQRPVKIIALPVMQLGFDIRLVKVVQRQLACLVRDGEVRHIAALSDPPQDRLRDDQRLKARRDPRLQLRDLDRIRPVLIIARKIGQQIIERENPKPLQSRRPRRPYAAQIGHGGK